MATNVAALQLPLQRRLVDHERLGIRLGSSRMGGATSTANPQTSSGLHETRYPDGRGDRYRPAFGPSDDQRDLVFFQLCEYGHVRREFSSVDRNGRYSLLGWFILLEPIVGRLQSRKSPTNPGLLQHRRLSVLFTGLDDSIHVRIARKT